MNSTPLLLVTFTFLLAVFYYIVGPARALSEIIATVLGASYPSVNRVWEIYNTLVTRFGDEYTVLIDAPLDVMSKTVDPQIAEAIVRVRTGKVKVIPGYDGVYGQLVIFEDQSETETKAKREPIKQRSIADFM